MKTRLSKFDIQYPEKNLLSALRDLTEGKFDNESFIHRALVVEIDHIGGRLEAPDNSTLPIWRCTDLAVIAEKGCKAVAVFGQ